MSPDNALAQYAVFCSQHDGAFFPYSAASHRPNSSLTARHSFHPIDETGDRPFYSRLFPKYLTRSSFSAGQPRKLIFREYHCDKPVLESEHIDYGEILWL